MKTIENAYDIETFYNEYKNMRSQKLNANELIEIPIIKTMIPNVKGSSVLDLGCGNGSMSKFFAINGAKKVLALDVSNNMINEARETNSDDNIVYKVLPMEMLEIVDEKFDVVYSSLAFHYIEDFNKLINDIYNLLNEDGILLFSQEHPLVTASILEKGLPKYVDINNKRYFYLSDYNNQGERHSKVAGTTLLTKYHRNFSTIINTLVQNDFKILEVKESYASDDVIKLVDKYKFQKDRPYFLFIKVQK